MKKTEDALFKWMIGNNIELVTATRVNDDIIDVHYVTTDHKIGSFIVIEDDDN